MTFLLREAQARDAAALSRFAAEVFAEAFEKDNDPDDLAAYLAEAFRPEIQAAEIAHPDYRTLLLEVGGEMAGWAQLRRVEAPPCITERADLPLPIELKRFYLAASFRGLGLAARLMEAAAGAAAAFGGKSLWLGVWEHNARAQAFYRKSGFEDVGSQIFQLGSDPQTDRIFARRLI